MTCEEEKSKSFYDIMRLQNVIWQMKIKKRKETIDATSEICNISFCDPVFYRRICLSDTLQREFFIT